jgi:protein-L-isoaspartate(D-aspartate) O-methyltransferase
VEARRVSQGRTNDVLTEDSQLGLLADTRAIRPLRRATTKDTLEERDTGAVRRTVSPLGPVTTNPRRTRFFTSGRQFWRSAIGVVALGGAVLAVRRGRIVAMLGRWAAWAVLVIAVCVQRASAVALQPAGGSFDAERVRMVDEQLKGRDIHDPRVLAVILRVPRHLFVPEPLRPQAYNDSPLPIGYNQTISQPYMVAFMTQALDVQPAHRVLEIGTGSGYQAAVLGLLARQVYTIEIVAPLAARARAVLADLGYRNVEVRTGNGYLGWTEHAPYDRIMVTAAPDKVPPALIQQLAIGGLMAIPVGTDTQQLHILRRTATGMETISSLPVRFVPMIGKP